MTERKGFWVAAGGVLSFLQESTITDPYPAKTSIDTHRHIELSRALGAQQSAAFGVLFRPWCPSVPFSPGDQHPEGIDLRPARSDPHAAGRSVNPAPSISSSSNSVRKIRLTWVSGRAVEAPLSRLRSTTGTSRSAITEHDGFNHVVVVVV